jgi:flagellar hook-length control protein FliK
MGAPMETQSTQHGLMQLFSAGVAADPKVSGIEGLGEQGFSSVLSGLLPDKAGQPMPLEDEGLPHLGQALPLEALTSNSLLINTSVSNTDVLNTDVLNTDESISDTSLLLNPIAEGESVTEVSAENESPSNLLEQQGFYAQSLVSSLIDQKTVTSQANTLNATAVATESSKSPSVMSQHLNQNTTSAIMTASQLEEESEVTERFLGSETTSASATPKKSTIELMTTPQAPVVLTTSAPAEANINLALALNEGPTSQSLDELIDSEVIEKGELEAKSNSLERKQDDQTLKLSKGQQAWGDALTERITMNAAKDIKQVTIHLDPPELGSLELKLHIKDDQQTQVHVQVQNHQVKEALESSAHRLRDMLAGQGLELSEFDVQADAGRGDQSAFDSDSQQGKEPSPDSDTFQQEGEEISVDIAKAKNNNILDTFV